MGWHNPRVPWQDLERALAGRVEPTDRLVDGIDAPASKRRSGYVRPVELATSRGTDDGGAACRVPYAELHCHSNFSFLDGASHPEELVEEAARLELDAVALTDHDGMYGVARFAEAARDVGVRTVFGTELSLGLSAPQNGVTDPEGEHLLLLAKGQDGYAALCRAVTAGQLAGHDQTGPGPDPGVGPRSVGRGTAGSDAGPGGPGQGRFGQGAAEKGRPVYDLDAVAAEVAGRCAVLTGCRKGAVRRALVEHGPAEAAARLRGLVDRFGAGNVYVELTDHGLPLDSTHNDALAGLAAELGLPTVATNAVHYATPQRGYLAQALAAIRARRGLDEMEGWLPSGPTAHLRSGAEMAHRFARYPGAVQRAALLGTECAFALHLVAPDLPPFPVPDGHDEASYLRERTYAGARERYGDRADNPAAYRQLDHELAVIERLGFPGYFLIVDDIVRFCRTNDILCQGRGSAANSAVCYALGITKVDPVRWKLLFERFLAPDRDGYPDIDLDIESDQREKVIQYVYDKHGRLRTAQVANVITYRARSAVRDAARALGHSPGQQDAWSKQIDQWGPVRQGRGTDQHDAPEEVLALAASLEDFPRHLGIHSGGMVICDRPVSEVVPIEWARMPGRSVLQWEKDDCASVGLVKFDLLGLGMLSALHYMVDLVAEHKGVRVDLSALDLDDDEVYAMLRRADAIGVFQVESRAQLATLPRLAPKTFYDLAIEVALIRPGPIQGGSVHPYIRRYTGRESWEHEHPLLANALDKTLGVPLFQEQLMQIALDVAGFTAAEADELRHAMGAKRSDRRMERLRRRFYEGAARNGVDESMAEHLFRKMKAFASYGFPESHALSFAYLVFASAFFKRYHPEAFLAGLLRAQPMGFYSPQSLVADARRHGVVVRGPEVNASLPHTTLEPRGSGESGHAVRLGLATVRTLGTDVAEEIVAERARGGPFRDMTDVARRVRLTTPQVEALATAGAFAGLEPDRRAALWAAGAVAQERPEKLPGTPGASAPTLPGMDRLEHAVADVWATGLSPDSFPTEFVRERLDALGVVTAEALAEVESGRRVLIGGAVTHRQRPGTAGGITFLNIEDETGMVNVVCTAGLWQRYHRIARSSPALLVRGVVERADGVVNLRADKMQRLTLGVPSTSRDFR